MRFIRKLHLYLGCFFSPLLLLFIGTGWYQTVGPPRKKLADSLPDKLASIHINQTFPAQSAGAYSTQWFEYLVVGMSIALTLTILLGIFLAFKTNKRKWPVCFLLALGVLVPVILLWLGQPAQSQP